MNRRVLSLIALCLLAAPAVAQDKWELAPGVLRTIPWDPQNHETYTGPITLPIPAPDWTPNFFPESETLAEMSKHVVLRRPVWNFEFSFKPLRMIEIDMPNAEGRIEKKLIWYMVYRLRYLGEDLKLSEQKTGFGGDLFPATETVPPSAPRRFYPKFLLSETQELGKSYLDRVIPAAKQPVFDREFSADRTENPGGKLYNSVEVSTIDIPVSTERDSKEVWGLVTWENVDPRVDYFSLYIAGLTNAFVMDVQDGKPGPLLHKTLKLNFWRPGDSVDENEEEIQFGIPVEPMPEERVEMLKRYGQNDHHDFLWLYR